MSKGTAGYSSLDILVCDSDPAARSLLITELRSSDLVSNVDFVDSVPTARQRLQDNTYNTVFIDPLTLGLEEASELIFATREEFPNIVFVLFIDRTAAEALGGSFYSGPRSRFSHYFMLDKRTPVAAFSDELTTALDQCRQYLSFREPLIELQEIRAQTSGLSDSDSRATASAVRELSAKLDKLLERVPGAGTRANVRNNTVFLSCRFEDSQYIDGLKQLLADKEFEVITGDNATGYISEAILQRIRESEFFMCLMTRKDEKADGTYTTSPWLLEEKGAALAFGKYLVLLVEEGVTDIGGLQGDWQRHHFTEKGFVSAALKAVNQLRSAAGGNDS
jgi:hypothetical protein